MPEPISPTAPADFGVVNEVMPDGAIRWTPARQEADGRWAYAYEIPREGEPLPDLATIPRLGDVVPIYRHAGKAWHGAAFASILRPGDDG